MNKSNNSTEMIQQKEYCDNTNSVKYIIENNDCTLFQTRIFSDEDARQFAKYGSAEEYLKLSESTKYEIYRQACVDYCSTSSSMFKAFVDEKREIGFYTVRKFAERNMHEHLAIILSKSNFTQHEYANLFYECSCKKSMDIVASYLNGEGLENVKNKLRDSMLYVYVTCAIIFLIFSLISVAFYTYNYKLAAYCFMIFMITINLCICGCSDILTTIEMHKIIRNISMTRDSFLKV